MLLLLPKDNRKDTDDIFHFDDLDVKLLLDGFIKLIHEVVGSVVSVGEIAFAAG